MSEDIKKKKANISSLSESLTENIRKKAVIDKAKGKGIRGAYLRSSTMRSVAGLVEEGFTDNDIQNASDVATMAATSGITAHSIIKAPKAAYKTAVITAKTAKGIYISVKYAKQLPVNIKERSREEIIRKVASTYILTGYNEEMSEIQSSAYHNKTRSANYDTTNRIISEAEKLGVFVSKKKSGYEDSMRKNNSDMILSDKYGYKDTNGINTMKQKYGTKGINQADNMVLSGNGDIVFEENHKKKYGIRKRNSKENVVEENVRFRAKSKRNSRIEKMKSFAKGTAIAALTQSDSKDGTFIKQIGVNYGSYIAGRTMDLTKTILSKFAVTMIKIVYAIAAAIAPFLFIPCIFIVLLIVLMQIPPLKWVITPGEAKPIVITYQEKMKEFGIKINSFEPNDNSIINYDIDEEQLRKNALIIFLAKKGINYDFDSVTDEDAKIYADIMSDMMLCTMNINSYVEIEDGSLITKKYIDSTVKAGENYNGQANGVYVQDSCNVHGVVGEITTSGAAKHTIQKWYFIPCEVSQYSVLPVGLCIQITEPNSKTSYVLQIVDKYEDTEDKNEYLYICGDMRTIDDDGNSKDINIYTEAYGPIRYFSNTNLIAQDHSVLYTGILDKARANEFPSYNIIYRSASSLAEEFDMTLEEQEEVFGRINDVTDEELINAKIMVPQKEINMWNEDIDYYASQNLSNDELESYEKVKQLVADNSANFDKYINGLLGEISADEITAELTDGAGASAESMTKYIADTYIKYGRYIPANASQFAKFIDDNGLTIDANSVQNGDFIFISRDVGTYKDVTDVAVKVEGGYLNCVNGKILYERTLRVNGINTYGTVVMYGRIN